MNTSTVYRSPIIYGFLMRVLYGRHYAARDAVIAELLPDQGQVIDLCCGPGTLFTHHLRDRPGIEYFGVDVNKAFLNHLGRQGASVIERDISDGAPLPMGDYLVMQASLYHFLPDHAESMISAMLTAARKAVIISEPIRNLSNSRFTPLARFSRASTDPGTGAHTNRFDEARLDETFRPFADRLQTSFLIPGGREKVYVLAGQGARS